MGNGGELGNFTTHFLLWIFHHLSFSALPKFLYFAKEANANNLSTKDSQITFCWLS